MVPITRSDFLRYRVILIGAAADKIASALENTKPLHRAVISRLKILSDLNISESRFPQDGRFSMPMGTEKANFRLSIAPTIYGEKAVVRVLTELSGQQNVAPTQAAWQRVVGPKNND